MRVECRLDYIEIENENGRMIDSVSVTCTRCEHATESFGTSSRSIRRCLALMREECESDESNHYFIPEEDLPGEMDE